MLKKYFDTQKTDQFIQSIFTQYIHQGESIDIRQFTDKKSLNTLNGQIF